MAIQTLVPQYYDHINSSNYGLLTSSSYTISIVNSSGTFDDYHHYVNDSNNATYLEASGYQITLSFGLGDILLRPEAITVNITASGSKSFAIPGANPDYSYHALFNKDDADSIIATYKTYSEFPASGRFDTYSKSLFLPYSGLNLENLEDSILTLRFLPSGEVGHHRMRISKVEVVVSGQPLNQEPCSLFIPGNVTNRNYGYPFIQVNSYTNGQVRANFADINFNRGHYLLDELSGSVIYSSGVSASGVFKYPNTHWYNYYRNPIGNNLFRQGVDVTHNGTGVNNYLDFGSNIPTGDFALYLSFLPSGESSTLSGGTGYKGRSLFSAGDISVECLNNTNTIRVTLAGNAISFNHSTFNNEWQNLFINYKDNTLKCYHDNVLRGQSYIPARINTSGNIIVGGYTDIIFSGGSVPFALGEPFALEEYGLSSFGWTTAQIDSFYKSLQGNYSDYLYPDLHPSADNTFISAKLLNASGEYTHNIPIIASGFPDSLINVTSPIIMNGDLIAPSSIILKLGVTSNTTNPSGFRLSFTSDLYDDLVLQTISPTYIQSYNKYLPSGYFQGFIELSGYPLSETSSGIFISDNYSYLNQDNLRNILFLTLTNPYNPSYSSEFKIHSAEYLVDGWFIPETGNSSIPLYVSGAPISQDDIDLFIEGEENQDSIDLFVRGLSTYSGNTTLFIMGGIEQKSCPLYTKGMIEESGNTTLFIAGQTERDTIPLYMHNESFPNSGQAALFIFGTSPGTNSNFDSINLHVGGGMSTTMPLYLHNEDSVETNDTMPLVLFGHLDGGTNSIPMYICNSGAESENDTTLFLMGSPFIDAEGSMPLYINRATSNDSHFTTLFIQNDGSELSSTLFTQGAYISDSGLTLFMPSSFTPTENSVRLYSHGY